MAHLTLARSPHLLPSLQMPISLILVILLFALFSLARMSPPRAFAPYHPSCKPNNATTRPRPHASSFHPSNSTALPRPRKNVTEPRDASVTEAFMPRSPSP